MKQILCYGDSNTWGFVPGVIDFSTMYVERYSRDIRWTGQLQSLLGNHYYVIEEGLNGRTTNIDYQDFPGKNGKTYLLPCLYSHAPLDLVVLMLGANDLKVEFNRSVATIAQGVEELIQNIQTTIYGCDMQSAPEILLIGYPEIVNESYLDQDGEKIFTGAVAKSKEFNAYYAQLADKYNCHYLNAAPHITLSDIDGIHLDEVGHRTMATMLAEKIHEIID